MREGYSVSSRWGLVFALMAGLGGAAAHGGQLDPDEAALLVLNSARRAYNENKHPFAAERFREFLKQYGGHREAASAHYGLAMALLEAPQKDYPGIIQALAQAVQRGDLPERPYGFYYMGVAQCGQGDEALEQARAKPNEAPQHQNTAKQRFEEAGRSFAQATAAFLQRHQVLSAPPAQDPTAAGQLLDWAARARCDQCEMLLRMQKFKEAADLAEAFLGDPTMSRSGYLPLAHYHLGYARFALGESLAAGRALGHLAPFQQEFGLHARYLLARTHHLLGERPEAATQYEAVLAGYEQRKKAAEEALRNPGALTPEHRARLEALIRNAPPDYLVRSAFYHSLLACEADRYADALAGFTAIIQQHPKSPLIPEAQLRLGFCQLGLRNFPEVIKTLTPLCNHPELGDRAMWWLARAQAGSAEPNNKQPLEAAIATLRGAAERANQIARTDPDAKIRRGDILLELADTMMAAGQYREAAAMYQTVVNERNNPDRAEEATQRQVAALHLAGTYKESDDLAAKFEQTYPKSTLLPAVWFRYAENAYLTAMAAAKNPNLPNRQQELQRLFGEAIRRYHRLVTAYPEFPYADLARSGMASAYYQLGAYKDAIAVLLAIPDPDRHGELASVNYVLADCLLRTLPEETDDALGAARFDQQAAEAAKLLERFVAAEPKDPQTPDALLKLGHCHRRIADVVADPAERQKKLTLARGAYELLLQQFANHSAAPEAAFERAKCLADLGDIGGATNELRRFQGDPFRQSPVAPLALMHLSRLSRAQNRAPDAVNVMQQCRAQHEGRLQADAARKDWVPLLQYEHALAVKESKKLPEARAMFEAIAKQFPDHPEAANALWRAGECAREELTAQLAAARQALAKAGAKSKEAEAAQKAVDQCLAGLRQAARALRNQADAHGRKAAGSEPHLRLLYEAAWCYRVIADAEIEEARRKLQEQAVEEVQARLAKQLPPGQAPPALRAPEFPLSAVSTGVAERAAWGLYGRLIAAAPAAPLAIRARLELAEMHAARGNEDATLSLLTDALAKDPPQELVETLKLRLAAALLAKDDPKAALPHVQAVLANDKSPLAREARYLAGEASSRQGDWAKAIELLLPFRDQGQFHNLPGISDRAVLRLGQAYAEAGKWDECRQTLNTLVQRYRESPWVDEALYRVGWSYQTQKQHDNAVNTYVQVTRGSASVWAARAQLQIGLCRLEQKRYPEAAPALLAVAYTYNFPECSAPAWCEAGRALVEMKQPAEAAEAWKRVIKDHPTSRWAKEARERLAGLEGAAKP